MQCSHMAFEFRAKNSNHAPKYISKLDLIKTTKMTKIVDDHFEECVAEIPIGQMSETMQCSHMAFEFRAKKFM